MSPAEFWKLSTTVSVAGAAGIVLLVTNLVALIKGWDDRRNLVGFGVAILVTLFARWIAPPPSSSALGAFSQFAAVTCLLYLGAFGGSKLALTRGIAIAAATGSKFWRPW